MQVIKDAVKNRIKKGAILRLITTMIMFISVTTSDMIGFFSVMYKEFFKLISNLVWK